MEGCFTWNLGFHGPSYPTFRTRHEGILMQFGDARMVSAQGALCVMLKAEGIPLHGERIEGQQGIGQRIAYAGNTLDGLCSLHSAQHSRNGSEQIGRAS